MQLKLTRNQLVDLMFALELAEDNAPGMRNGVISGSSSGYNWRFMMPA